MDLEVTVNMKALLGPGEGCEWSETFRMSLRDYTRLLDAWVTSVESIWRAGMVIHVRESWCHRDTPLTAYNVLSIDARPI